jgi:hypothetical protein
MKARARSPEGSADGCSSSSSKRRKSGAAGADDIAQRFKYGYDIYAEGQGGGSKTRASSLEGYDDECLDSPSKRRKNGAARVDGPPSSSERRQSGAPGKDDITQHTAGPWPYIKHGEKSAKVIQELEKRKTSVEGNDERDAFGANPLHLATLFSKTPRFKHGYVEEKKRQEEEERLSRKDFFNHDSMDWKEDAEHERITMAIWTKFENLRTQAYDRADYEGETAIHLAIAKRRGDLVEKFLDSLTKADKKDDKAILINSRAVGTFDVAHFETTDGIKRCKFGCVCVRVRVRVRVCVCVCVCVFARSRSSVLVSILYSII